MYIHFALTYKTDHIFPVLRIKHLVDKDSKTTIYYFKLVQVQIIQYHIYACYFAHLLYGKLLQLLTKKVLNLIHQAQKDFRRIFVVITQQQKVYIVHAPSTRKIISSYDVAFDESFSSAMAYMSQP